MADIVVKVQRDRAADYDYLAFSFDGKHSFEDFGLVRVSNGSRYDLNLTPTMQDKTAEVPGGDGLYYFGTFYKQKEFPISFAFDGLTNAKYKEMEAWLNGKAVAPLWFDEEPYKVYMAKVTGNPAIKVVTFDDYYTENGVTKVRRLFKGEGTVNFTAYNPLARTPDYVALRVPCYQVENTKTTSSGISLTGSIRTTTNNTFTIYEIIPTGTRERRDYYLALYRNNTEVVGGIAFNEALMAYALPSSKTFDEISMTLPDSSTTPSETVKLAISYKQGQNTYWIDNGVGRLEGELRYDGRLASSYDYFQNKDLWINESGLTNTLTQRGGTAAGPAQVYYSTAVTGDITNIRLRNVDTGVETSLNVTFHDLNNEQVLWDTNTGLVKARAVGEVEWTRAVKATGLTKIDLQPNEELIVDGAVLRPYYYY